MRFWRYAPISRLNCGKGCSQHAGSQLIAGLVFTYISIKETNKFQKTPPMHLSLSHSWHQSGIGSPLSTDHCFRFDTYSSAMTSHICWTSAKPLRRASTAGCSADGQQCRYETSSRPTVCLNSDVHLCLGRVRNCVGAEFDIRTTPSTKPSDLSKQINLLFHNDISQNIAHSVSLFKKLKRSRSLGRARKLAEISPRSHR